MAVCAPSGPGQHHRDGDRDGAGTHGEAAAGSNDRTSGSASLPARTARPGQRRRAASPSRRPPADHPSPAGVNRDASLFLRDRPRLAGQRRHPRTRSPVLPDTGPSARHACADLAGFAASADPRSAPSGGAPVRSNRRCSRSVRGRSSGTRRPRSRTARIRTDGQTPRRTARHRSCGVDERRPRQDTPPACVLPARCGARRRGKTARFSSAPCLHSSLARVRLLAQALAASAHSPVSGKPANTAPGHAPRPLTPAAPPEHAAAATTPGRGPPMQRAKLRQPTTMIRMIGLKSAGQFK